MEIKGVRGRRRMQPIGNSRNKRIFWERGGN
jgi:hypothetical protein